MAVANAGSRDGAGRLRRRRPRGVQAALVSGALLASNASSYAFIIVAARLLAPSAFGELSALVAVLVVGVVPAYSLQTGVALYVAGRVESGTERAVAGRPLALGLALGAGVGAVALAAAPALAALLRLSDAGSAMVLPLALMTYPVLGAMYGVLQGRQRFGMLALLIGLEALGRSGAAAAGLVVGGTPRSAFVGVAIGVAVVAVIGWWVCGRPVPRGLDRGLLQRVAHAALATVGLVLLLNLDIMLARHFLARDSSGVYAVGLVLTKIAYWLPQAVGVIVLPRLADPGGRRKSVLFAVAVVAGLDAPVVLGAALFGHRLLPLIGGGGYVGTAAPVWLFAITGSLLAVAQILLFSRIASADVRSILAVWLAILVEIGLVAWWLDGSVRQIASAAAVTAGLLVLTGALVETGAGRRRTVKVGSARHPDGAGGDPGADGHEHRGLGGGAVGPVLPLTEQAPGDGDRGRRRRAAERHGPEGAGAQLPQQRAGDQQHHGQHPAERGHEDDDRRGRPVPTVGRPGERAGAVPAADRQRGQHEGE